MSEDYNERTAREIIKYNNCRTNSDLKFIMLKDNNASRLVKEIITRSNSIMREQD